MDLISSFLFLHGKGLYYVCRLNSLIIILTGFIVFLKWDVAQEDSLRKWMHYKAEEKG